VFTASVVFSGWNWLLPAALFAGAALLLVAWSYRRAAGGPGHRLACATLKLAGILALAACLLEPMWSGQRARPGSNFFLVVADNSQGLKIQDKGETRSRGEQLRSLLDPAATPAGHWLGALEENFQTRRYLFDTRLQPSRDFSELNFEGRATAMFNALRQAADRFQGRPLAGILLFTDGNATDLPEGGPDWAGLPPVYPVVLGSDDLAPDLALQKVAVTQTAFEDAPVTVQAEVAAPGFAGADVVARLFNLPGGGPATPGGSNTPPPLLTEKLVGEVTQRAPRNGDAVNFRFQFRPERPGLSFYRLGVEPKGAAPAPGAASAEATLANNARVLVVDRGQGPYRILYVCGRPNWEFKFLNRALMADDQVQLVGLLRVARREPKFEFRGRAGESSNPLFRGFGNQSKEEIERYDQPVLIRLNTRDEHELRGGFPKTPEHLFAYHAVIVDDLEAEFFSPDQMSLLQKFVSERGGGLLMLGGAEAFAQGGYHRTPIGDVLPVYLDAATESPSEPAAGWRIDFTREGWLQPWARLRDQESTEKQRLAEVPPFLTLNKVRGAKPGASVVATVNDGRGRAWPALVVQRFGHGRTAAITLGDVWHWGLADESKHRDMDKAWRQLVRWLVADVPARVELAAEPKRDDPNGEVSLQVRARDRTFQPLDNAAVAVEVRPVGSAGTNVIRLNAEPSLKEPGLYEASYVPRQTGGYRADAVATDANGVEVGRAVAGWASDPAAEEFKSLKPNRALLENLARQTGGEVIDADRLAAFARGLPNRKAPVTETWTSPLWHRTGVFLFALACFVAEWGLRRWRGLA
jgi:uncharacterized membrane protein